MSIYKKEYPFRLMEKEYIFAAIKKKINETKEPLVDLSIGDISYPLNIGPMDALCEGAKEMASSVIGYGPATGYPFLKKKIASVFYENTEIKHEEICISDGIKGQIPLFLQMLSPGATVAIENPSYPLYKNLIEHYGLNTYNLTLTAKQNFQPSLPSQPVDMVILCSPHNPTGTAYTSETLKKFVDYAKKNQTLIVFDAAYASYHRGQAPMSIFEIDGANQVAVELCSFSKGYGFTGLRLGYTVIPKQLKYKQKNLLSYWNNMQSLISNGFSYPTQKAAFSAINDASPHHNLQNQYLNYAGKIKQLLKSQGYSVYGGISNPFLWWNVNQSGTVFWEYLFQEKKIVSVPGLAFGTEGDQYVRLSCFINEQTFRKAYQVLEKI